MAVSSAAVAVVFGLIMGWVMGRMLDDLRPIILTFAAGTVLGAVTWTVSSQVSTATGGASLVLGCVAGFLGLIPRHTAS